MKTKAKYWGGACMLIGVCLLCSCSDLIEKDISKKSIKLFAPKDQTSSKVYSINYWWEELPGATNYRLQIVQTDSSFKDSVSLVTDTLVGKNQFRKSMNPGHYLWSVYGVNGAYSSTRSAVWRLSIDSSTIAGQDIQLIRPASGTTTYTRESSYSISWEELSGAKKYQLSIDSFDIPTTRLLAGSSYVLKFGNEGEYKISVIGVDGNLQSNVSQTSLLVYDRTPPDSVELVSPANKSINIDTLQSLSWKEPADMSGISTYKLTLTGPRSNNETVFTKDLNTVSFSLSGLRLKPLTEYSWKVGATDKAGNFKESRPFTFKTK